MRRLVQAKKQTATGTDLHSASALEKSSSINLLDRPFCERSILYFAHVSFFIFFPTHFFRRLQTDFFETFPHDVALLEKEALLNRFSKSAP